jgi:anti-sigma regulatory factor (Ser/Thr protein kinase)/anti-anti-sigma regulatory factor
VVREVRGDVCVLSCSTSLKGEGVEALRRELESCRAADLRAVVVDLEGGRPPYDGLVHVLKAAAKSLSAGGGELIVAAESAAVREALAEAGLDVPVGPGLGPDTEGGTSVSLPPEPRWRHQFSFAATVAELPSARRRVVRLSEVCGLSGAPLFELGVAVGEALANAVRHGSPGGSRDEVSVRFFCYDDEVAVEVADQGGGMDAAPICAPDAMAPSGRGIHFMRTLSDGLLVSCGAHGTRVLLAKRRR